jgi:hypothetical protein
MLLSQNEIRARATAFVRDWRDDRGLEREEAQTFWNEFLQIFGVNRRRVASFEVPVRNLFSAARNDAQRGGRIDLLWKGRLLAEHKSRGQSLDRAAAQARDYFDGLKDRDLPRLTVVSDFDRIRVYDTDVGPPGHYVEFPLADLPDNTGIFGVLSGHETRDFGNLREVDRKAAQELRAMHDELREARYDGHPLEVLMVRLLFCLFADRAGIWEPGLFRDYLADRTGDDGTDLGPRLNRIFAVLDTPPAQRGTNLDETLMALPYVNGALFSERHDAADFNGSLRERLLDLAGLDWAAISPEIFGSLFQGIRSTAERRLHGEHYTSEANILKALGPLFLDDLRAEFKSARRDPRRLTDFHRKLASIRVLDPACGCGNFLVVAYRELRLLELEVLKVRYNATDRSIVRFERILSELRVEQFAGIERDDWPAQIARVAMWMTDHQMNKKVSAEFALLQQNFPLGDGARVTVGNALTVDWGAAAGGLDALNYIVGNPPFYGSKTMSAEQRADVVQVWGGMKNAGLLDFVTCWYALCARAMEKNPNIECALVSTNSITQGEQPGILWTAACMRGVRINFAHRTFRWSSAAAGPAGVSCVILGFSRVERAAKTIYDYGTLDANPVAISASVINPYLVDAPFTVLSKRGTPICTEAPRIGIGNKPIDGGFYFFSPAEKAAFLRDEPSAAPLFRRWVGADELIGGTERWFLWLKDIEPDALRRLPHVRKRVGLVQRFRRGEIRGANGRQARDAATKDLANLPTRLHVENVPAHDYLVIPRHSSEGRKYIPLGWMPPDVLCGDANLVIADATLYDFGILTSLMHMAWMRAVCGRLESRYRYSAGIVYNNYPWPDSTSGKRSKRLSRNVSGMIA